MAIDRRVSRTRNALYEAISALMLTKPYAEIEVQDITARANVGRSTFYTHFRSKDELLVRSLERLRPFLAEGRQAQLTAPRIGSCEGTLALFRQVANQRPLLDAMNEMLEFDQVKRYMEADIIEIVPLATFREPDGLAMSSRNRYLSADERALAPTLHEVMQTLAARIRNDDPLFQAVADAQTEIITAGFELDYLEARHADTLAPVTSRADGPIRLLIAARIGGTRLIDNIGV